MFLAGTLLIAVPLPVLQEGGGCSTASFSQASGSPFELGGRPHSIAVGDFDLDGNPDVAITSEETHTVTISIGNGTGGFLDGAELGAGTVPRGLAVGDFNLDGKPDLAIAALGSITIRLGDGAGGFPDVSSTAVSPGVSSSDVAVGDLNLDGKPDLAVAFGFGSVGTLLGDGMGGFTVNSSWGGGASPSSVAIADLNVDGKPDLAVCGYDSDNVTILIGDGTGGFSGGSVVGAGNGPEGVAVGDFNFDGKPDLAIANELGASVTIRLGDGSGGFPDASSSSVSAGHIPRDVAIADLNFDGKLDLAIVCRNEVTIRLGDGLGGFADVSSIVTGDNRCMAMEDFNRDGRPDLAVPHERMISGPPSPTLSYGITVLTNVCDALPCGGTSFSEAGGPSPDLGDFPTSIAVGDFNLDAKPDLAVTNDFSDNVTILIGDGSGGFPGGSVLGAGIAPGGVAVGDFNLDGKPDLAIANFITQDVTIRLGDGAGGFPDATSSTVGVNASANQVAVGDLNLDGKPDLAVTTYYDRVTILLGDGTGGFSVSSTWSAGAVAYGVAIADLNLDGKPDLAISNIDGNSVTVRLGDGLGGFPDAASSTVGVGTGPVSLAIGDLNSDGKPDLAVANRDADSVTIRLGDGLGGFPDVGSSTLSAGGSPRGVAIGDLDSDGKPDLALASLSSFAVTIRLGDGAGGFPHVLSAGTGDVPLMLAMGDFDLDGKTDLAVPQGLESNAFVVTLLLNTCTPNQPPVADAGDDQTVECAGGTAGVTLDGSDSSDEIPGALTYSWSEGGNVIGTGVAPAVTLSTGSHAITLTVTDLHGKTSSDGVTIVIADTAAPTIVLTTNVISLSRANHKYVAFDVSAFASGASDGCDSAIDVSDVMIASVSSDEPEDARGNGDGNTLADIVIAPGCTSVQLRAERGDLLNGRVYTVTLAVRDASGNLGTATRRVFVPVIAGGIATDDGASAGYTVSGDCPTGN